jgi:hypothetical protein
MPDGASSQIGFPADFGSGSTARVYYLQRPFRDMVRWVWSCGIGQGNVPSAVEVPEAIKRVIGRAAETLLYRDDGGIKRCGTAGTGGDEI